MANIPQAKHWVFTSYEKEFKFTDKMQYLLYGYEKCPTTGRNHLQGYVCFKKKQKLSALKKLDATAHFEVRRGTIQQAIDYCKKEGRYVEFGDLPDDNSGCAIRECIALAKKGDIESIEDRSPGLYLRYKRTFETMRQCNLDPLSEPRGYWVYGKPGTSKDSNVLKLNPFVKSHNKWWDGYNGQEYILMSDFDMNTARWAGTHLKLWTDRYPFDGEIKGGVMKINPKRFYVTSNYNLDDLFTGSMLYALQRRFHIICFDDDTIRKRPRIDVVDKLDLVDF